MDDDLEKYIEREEMIWELWFRLLLARVMPTTHMYEEALRIRAGRKPEDWYGIPEE